MDQSSPTAEEGRGQELLEVPLDDPSSHTKRATTPTSLEKMENFVDSIGDWDLSRKLTKKDIKRVVIGEVQDHEEVFDSKDDVEVTTNKDKAKWAFSTVKNFITGVIIPLVDIGTDLFAAGTHFWWGDVTWGCLTLLFVGMPGFVCGLTIAVYGLRMKPVTPKRLLNYSLCILLGPIAYPLLQIVVSGYMVYHMVIRRDTAPVKVMKHDVRQFKSLEGYLESGPQFVLQSYILLKGEKRSLDNMQEQQVERILILLLSITISLISLTKAAVTVNKADVDENRTSTQTPPQSSTVRSDVNPLQRFLRGVQAVRGRLLLRLRARLCQRSTRGRLPDQRRTLSLHSYLQNHASRPVQRTLHFRAKRLSVVQFCWNFPGGLHLQANQIVPLSTHGSGNVYFHGTNAGHHGTLQSRRSQTYHSYRKVTAWIY